MMKSYFLLFLFLLSILGLFLMPYECHVVRTYEIDGLTFCDYVSGDNVFKQVYIEDVPEHVLKGEK